ncbi:biopolymer transporter ExbB [Sphingomonas sp. Leaf339]|uniref:MotA/TolQ/ExbB proton channel family protein n=1 Tax=Sphingomonas sp. Leaf339 TaxID=1736343 RepID=UPI0006FD8E5A|nr:MotA/TolQ/ExbB proton channel family protein [Sphingomonas sp. Leaf339]KQU61710.1 biopolymer transporter ExbB [Sphingomonas sp. Leaf339]
MQVATLYDPVALAVVVGGTVVASILRTPLRDMVRGIRALVVLRRRRFSAEPLLRQVAALSRIAQRHGVHALDRTVITDPDIALAVVAIVDGSTAVEVEAIVRASRGNRIERHVAVAEMWAAAAEAAPAMGMVGTLIGLARMFADMENTAAIGAGMAVALLATLYGALLANFILAPIAARLRAAGRAEALERVRLDAPLVALAERETPRLPHGHPLQSVA